MPTADCGHNYNEPGQAGGASGYAVLRSGREVPGQDVYVFAEGRICYACADACELADLRTEDVFFGYLSSQGWSVTTWTGGKLGEVLPGMRTRTHYTPSGGRYEVTYLRMRDVHGAEWHGRGAGRGMYVRLRRVKGIMGRPDHACGRTDDDGNALPPAVVTCGKCRRSWCERCDPAPSALCVFCHGRGTSDAELKPAEVNRLTKVAVSA